MTDKEYYEMSAQLSRWIERQMDENFLIGHATSDQLYRGSGVEPLDVSDCKTRGQIMDKMGLCRLIV